MTKLSNFSTEKGSKNENLPTINKSPKFEQKPFFSIGQFQRKKHLMVIWNNSTVFNAQQLVKGQDSRMDHNFLKETHTQKKRDWFGMTSSLY